MEIQEKYPRTESFTIAQIIELMSNETFVIPVLQRRLEWNNQDMESLFETVFQNNCFGSISAIKQTSGTPIFPNHRYFTTNKDDKPVSYSHNTQPINERNPIYFILDGQQRLQTFLISLMGKQEEKMLFNLYTGEFKISQTIPENNLWLEAKKIFKYLATRGNTYCDFLNSYDIPQEHKNNCQNNIFKFYYNIFFAKQITISLVYQDKPYTIDDKNRFIKLFTKLNTGGTKLSEEEVLLCNWKGFKPELEDFVDNIIEHERLYPGWNFTENFTKSIAHTIHKNNIHNLESNECAEYIQNYEDNLRNMIKEFDSLFTEFRPYKRALYSQICFVTLQFLINNNIKNISMDNQTKLKIQRYIINETAHKVFSKEVLNNSIDNSTDKDAVPKYLKYIEYFDKNNLLENGIISIIGYGKNLKTGQGNLNINERIDNVKDSMTQDRFRQFIKTYNIPQGDNISVTQLRQCLHDRVWELYKFNTIKD